MSTAQVPISEIPRLAWMATHRLRSTKQKYTYRRYTEYLSKMPTIPERGGVLSPGMTWLREEFDQPSLGEEEFDALHDLSPDDGDKETPRKSSPNGKAEKIAGADKVSKASTLLSPAKVLKKTLKAASKSGLNFLGSARNMLASTEKVAPEEELEPVDVEAEFFQSAEAMEVRYGRSGMDDEIKARGGDADEGESGDEDRKSVFMGSAGRGGRDRY